MNELLQATAKMLSEWLETSLPPLSANWWTELVVEQLNDTQREQVKRRRISSMAGLDLAALLRVLHQNWNQLGRSNPSLTRDAFTWLNELQGARNRWAHPPAGGIAECISIRDADTMARLLKTLGTNDDLLEKIEMFKAHCLVAMRSPASPVPPPVDARAKLPEELPAATPVGSKVEPLPPDATATEVLAIAPGPARRVIGAWQSKTGSDYMNVGIEAQIVEVEVVSPKIVLTYVDESGDEQTVEDFGRDGKLEQAVFDYLKENEGRRAFFILTKKPADRKEKLASNTMMWREYVRHWQT